MLMASAALPLVLGTAAQAQTTPTATAEPQQVPPTSSTTAPQPIPAPTLSPETAAEVGQEQASEPDIIVSGIRDTIQTSINEKKNENAIVDVLTASEIGDLPVLSVGEAIQTITGATTHREKGGASEIALRGLGSFLSNTTFNGRDATNGSGDRAVNFNQFPSELVNGIKIYKSQQANLIEGGVAGTIEIGTIRPLDYGKRTIQAEIKGSYSPYQDRIVGSDAWGYRATLSYIDQYDLGGLGEVGIALGFQRNQTNNPEETVAGSTTWVACNAAIVVANGNCTEVSRAQGNTGTPFYLVPNSITFRQINEDDKRDAFFGALQWQPSDALNINLDLQYSDRGYVEDRHDLNLSEARYGLTNVVYDDNGVVQSLNGISSVESTNAILSRNEEYLGGGLSMAWKPADRLSISMDGSYSRTIRTEVERNARLRTDPTDVNGVRTPFNNMRIPYSYSVEPGNFAQTITFDPRFNPNNPNLFWDDARLRRDEVARRNEIWGVRLDGRYEIDGLLKAVSIGGRVARLTYEDFDTRREFNLNPAIAEDRRINNLCRRGFFPQSDFLSKAEGNTITSWATYDGDCLFREYVGQADPGGPDDTRNVINSDITETTYAGYLMGDYGGDLGSLPVRGNFGVRVVRTEVSSLGLRSDLNVVTNPDGSIRLVPSAAFQTQTIEAATTRVLPSANATFEVARNTLVRLAGYRGLSRPAPSALGAGRTIQLEDGTNFTSVGDAISLIQATGSPRLEPLMSWNVDAAFEWYPNRDTIVATTVYHKWFNGGFLPVVLDEEFTIGGQAVTVPVVQTTNSDRQSRAYGLEVTLATRFSFLPAPLDGFGGKVSYNLAFADFENEDIRLGDVLDPITGAVQEGLIPPAGLNGYSKHVVSTQLYYQLGPLQLQGIYNYRSNYYHDFVGGNNQLRYVRENDTLDLRASFAASRQVRFQIEALNITDTPKVTDMPVRNSIRQYHYYGPRYFLGLRVRL